MCAFSSRNSQSTVIRQERQSSRELDPVASEPTRRCRGRRRGRPEQEAPGAGRAAGLRGNQACRRERPKPARKGGGGGTHRGRRRWGPGGFGGDGRRDPTAVGLTGVSTGGARAPKGRVPAARSGQCPPSMGLGWSALSGWPGRRKRLGHGDRRPRGSRPGWGERPVGGGAQGLPALLPRLCSQIVTEVTGRL